MNSNNQQNQQSQQNQDALSQLLRVLPLLSGLGVVVALFNGMQTQLTKLETRLDYQSTAIAEAVQELKIDVKDIKNIQAQNTTKLQRLP